MQTSFTFNGIDITTYGLSYTPTNEETYVWKPAQYNLHEQNIENHDTAYFYGASKQPKQFNLRCIFETVTISDGLLFKIYNDFKIGKSGKLRFSNRPWIYYDVVITNIEHSITNYKNGIVNFQMKAYEGVGHADTNYIDETADYADDMKKNSNMLPFDALGTQTISNINNTTSIFIYNGGSEYAHTKISINAETSNGINIYNKNTTQMCILTPWTLQSTDKVVIDSYSGKTVLDSNGTVTPKYLYHDSGFVTLKPNLHIHANASAEVSLIGVVTCEKDIFTEDMVGNIITDGTMSKVITSVINSKKCTIGGLFADGYTYDDFYICEANEIVVSAPEGQSLSIDELTIDFKTTFA